MHTHSSPFHAARIFGGARRRMLVSTGLAVALALTATAPIGRAGSADPADARDFAGIGAEGEVSDFAGADLQDGRHGDEALQGPPGGIAPRPTPRRPGGGGPGGITGPRTRPPFEVTNIQPAVGRLGRIVIEPVAPESTSDGQTWLSNVDIDFKNDSTEWLRLDKVWVDYTGAGLGATSFAGKDLLRFKTSNTRLYYDAWHRHGITTELATGLGEGFEGYSQAYYRGLAMDDSNPIFVGVGFALQPRFLVARYGTDGFVEMAVPAFEDMTPAWANDAHSNGIQVFAAGRATVGGQARMAVAGFVASDLDPVTSFGDVVGDERSGRTTIAVPGCANAEAEGIDRAVWNDGAVQFGYAVAGDALCDEPSIALAFLRTDGDPRPDFNGGQVVTSAHPSGAPLEVAGVRFVPGGGGDGPWIYVAAKVGTTCSDANWIQKGDCHFGLTRFGTDGDQDAGFGDDGWVRVDFHKALHAGVEAIAYDQTTDHILLGGWAAYDDGDPTLERRWALAALELDGTRDKTWGLKGDPKGTIICCPGGGGGRLTHLFSGRSGAIRDLDVRNGELAAAGWALNAGGDWDFAVGRYSAKGEPRWGMLGYTPEGFDEDLSAVAYGVAFDPGGKVILAGSAPGGGKLGTARFHDVGRLDSLLEIAPGATRHLKWPDKRVLNLPPSALHLGLETEEYPELFVESIPVWEHSTPVIGSYAYPLTGLQPGEVFSQGQHHELDTNHRNSLSQRYAYDIGAARWDAGAGKWVGTIEGGEDGLDPEGDEIDGSKNLHSLVYGKQVVSMAAGRVIECYRDLPENPEPGVIDTNVTAIAGGGNMLWIVHESGEVALYAHMQPNTIPASTCPVNGPDYYDTNVVTVEAGDPLGLVGNSGSSSGPHLHVHVQVGHTLLGSANEGLPQLFNGIEVLDKGKAAVGPNPPGWADVLERAIPAGVFVRGPFELPIGGGR